MKLLEVSDMVKTLNNMFKNMKKKMDKIDTNMEIFFF